MICDDIFEIEKKTIPLPQDQAPLHWAETSKTYKDFLLHNGSFDIKEWYWNDKQMGGGRTDPKTFSQGYVDGLGKN